MHKSVLLKESIEYLNLKADGIYVDATLGYAGHSSEILKKITRGYLFAFDQDINAIKYSEEKLKKIGSNFAIIKNNFENIKEELNKRNIEKVDGLLFDIGVSSPQLDNAERGFSYHMDARLDMRMDINQDLSAYDVINNYTYDKLVDIFFRYGEEPYSRSIAKNIVEARKEKPINTTLELVEIIKRSVPEKKKREGHPARQIFQAVRIEVNRELEVLEKALEEAIELLKPNGRLCVITFHSLEDKICKKIFKKYSDIDAKVKGLPIIPIEYQPKVRLITKGIVEANDEELELNSRARSAKLRVLEKI
jgi:16S rRNA (cytosine1402-N4)-methyltransferase